jgi:peptidoglycan/xylan/chitin deacetylase (PgdA/CDA1 family)
LPNKMGEYLASGRPVVTCKIGDLTNFLIDNVNAYLAEPGNERDFAAKMIAVLQDPARAEQIGAAGQHSCLAHLDYRAHVGGLSRFFICCIGSHQKARSTRSEGDRTHRGYRVVRNCLCGLLALGVIASGGVRRARNRALRGDAVTAIYFHKPNKRLFGRCVRWLTRHGYTFISADDLFAVLYRGKTAPTGAVWLSFDDGCKQLSADVLPLTHEHKVPVTLFIPTGIIGDDGRLPWLHEKTDRNSSVENGRDTLSIAELQQIATYPEVTIASHTVNHAVTAGLTRDEVRFELAESKRTLESWIQTGVKYFAYPVGQFDGRERSVLAECGYALAATTENALITQETDPYLIPRFSIGDEISFPEAICNMVGVWRPMIDRFKNFLRHLSRITELLGVTQAERLGGSQPPTRR